MDEHQQELQDKLEELKLYEREEEINVNSIVYLFSIETNFNKFLSIIFRSKAKRVF